MGFFDIFKVNQYKAEIESLKSQNEEMNRKLSELGAYDYYTLQEKISRLTENLSSLQKEQEQISDSIEQRTQEVERLEKQVLSTKRKIARGKELYKAMEYSMDQYLEYSPSSSELKLPASDVDEIEEFSPSVILKLHCMDVKDLRKAYRSNDKQITEVLNKYASRYTTKANRTIYQLMVIALRSELQNILYNLKYEKLDTAIEQVKTMTSKYLSIAAEGNQSIAGTLTKFIGEIEYLFTNAVQIEYNYYVKKEQSRQEQLAIREQMRQEAEERKALEAERKKVEKEEAKYKTEIERLEEQKKSSSGEDLEGLEARIAELEAQLAAVNEKKDKIITLQNGKAGTVYVISNLGSFGENMFKIGMTRRQDPQDRVNELGDASVPFKFDVHSFIFSDDAVSLESKLHNILNEKRVNKVNLRKEFFHTTIDELEALVNEISPTAEFNRTMAAEEYRQSLSASENYTSEYTVDLDEE